MRRLVTTAIGIDAGPALNSRASTHFAWGLLKGNKSDRIDARKLSELLRSNLLRSVFHDDTGLRTLKELARSYLTITKDVTRMMVSTEGHLPKLGYSLWRPASLLAAPSCRMARENHRSRCSLAGGFKGHLTVFELLFQPRSDSRNGRFQAP